MARNACSRPPITLRSHYLHVGDIKGVVGKIASYHEKSSSLLSLVPVGYASVGLSLGFHFVFCVMVLAINFYLIFGPLCFANKLRNN